MKKTEFDINNSSYLQRVLNEIYEVNKNSIHEDKLPHEYYSQIKDFEFKLRDALMQNATGYFVFTLIKSVCWEHRHHAFFKEVKNIYEKK